MDPQDHILDHYHNPRHNHALFNATHQSDVKNLSCGDTLHIEVIVQNDIIQQIGWTGTGCSISQASASLLSEFAEGKSVKEIVGLEAKDILLLLKIPLSPGRLKCGILSLEALHKALIRL